MSPFRMPCRRVVTLAPGTERPLSRLINRVRGAFAAFTARTACRPDRYLLFTNLRLDRAYDGARLQLERSILHGDDPGAKAEVAIIGAEQMAELLNREPFLRTVFFGDGSFRLWREEWSEHSRSKMFGVHVELVGRDDELALLNSTIVDPLVRAVVITGPDHMGKTRLALEATSSWQRQTVIIPAARLATLPDLRRLRTPGRETIAIVDDCTSDQAREAVAQAQGEPNLKLILTVPAAAYENGTFRAESSWIKEIKLGPLSGRSIGELLERVVTGLDRETASWLMRESEGRPGIIVSALDLRHRLRRSAPNLLEAMVQGMEYRIQREFGEYGIRILRVLSLVTSVDTSNPNLSEIGTACRLIGDGLKPQSVFRALPGLQEAGIIRQTGRRAEVIPEFLADHLAREALSAHPEHSAAVIRTLGARGRLLSPAARPAIAPRDDEAIDRTMNQLVPLGAGA